MHRPKLVFKISKTIDVDVGLAFRTVKAGGIDFRRCGILAPHPDLRTRRLTRTVIIAYTKRFYREHGEELEKARGDFERTWRRTSKTFFLLAKKLFGSGFPPPGTYTCSPSMWNCNTRDIPHKVFQIFYRNEHPVEMMIHEMLHFAFYEYVYRRYPHLKHTKNTYRLWELSEAFNTVILNSPEWRKRFGTRRQPSYPALRDLAQTMRRRWIRSRSLDVMLGGLLPEKKEEVPVHLRVQSSRLASASRSRTGSRSAAAGVR
ncbi:MAG: hypothetical protein AAB413_00730 [Patescibacteria group bacterium]